MPTTFPKFVHWAARCVALIVAIFFLTLLLGEVTAPHSRAPSGFKEWGQIALLIGAIAGMLAAWKWELPGAIFSLGALVLWALLVRVNRYPDVIALLASPGLLFLSDWALHFGRRHNRNP